MSRLAVSVYETTQVYGGAEEGGWYYPVTELQYTIRCKSNKLAKKKARELNEDFHENYNDSCEYKVAYLEKHKNIGREDDTDQPTPRYC